MNKTNESILYLNFEQLVSTPPLSDQANTLIPKPKAPHHSFWNSSSVVNPFAPVIPQPSTQDKQKEQYKGIIERNRRQRTHKKKRKPEQEHKKCHWCDCTDTPEWRRGPDDGEKKTVLCNACGLQYRLKLKGEQDSKKKNSILNLLNPPSSTEKANIEKIQTEQKTQKAQKAKETVSSTNIEERHPKRQRLITNVETAENLSLNKENSYKKLFGEIMEDKPISTSFNDKQMEALTQLISYKAKTLDSPKKNVIFEVDNLSPEFPHFFIINSNRFLPIDKTSQRIEPGSPTTPWILSSTSPLPPFASVETKSTTQDSVPRQEENDGTPLINL